ncbi:hypothetical protein EAO71_04260 [Streptomyces sp. ms191]|nr:hypothetical protein EAO71_04260 [Streptomyces sp. ms191]
MGRGGRSNVRLRGGDRGERGIRRTPTCLARGPGEDSLPLHRREKDKRQGELSLPLSTYSAPGGLPQGPRQGAQSSACAHNLRKRGRDARVPLSTYAGCGGVER